MFAENFDREASVVAVGIASRVTCLSMTVTLPRST